jgi:hypothetical protein
MTNLEQPSKGAETQPPEEIYTTEPIINNLLNDLPPIEDSTLGADTEAFLEETTEGVEPNNTDNQSENGNGQLGDQGLKVPENDSHLGEDSAIDNFLNHEKK